MKGQKKIKKFSNFISYVISTTTKEHLFFFFVMINMVSIVKIRLVLNLKYYDCI